MKNIFPIFCLLCSVFMFFTETSWANGLPGMGDFWQPVNKDHVRPDTDSRSAATAEFFNKRPPVHGAQILPGRVGDGVSFVRDSLFPKITNAILVTALSLSVVFLIISGIMYILSSGGDLKDKAREGITWSIVGVVVISLSYAIVSLVIGLDFTGN